MKKIKLFAPILGVTAAVSTVAPLTMLTSCSDKNKINYVTLAAGQKAEKTISASLTQATYRFNQENLEDAIDTKVGVANFKVNGLDHNLWDSAFTYRVDSAGHIIFNVNTYKILNSMSGEVTNITFDLVFKNKTANTNHALTGFKINFEYEEHSSPAVEVPELSISDNIEISANLFHNEDYWHVIIQTKDSQLYIESIVVTDPTTQETLVEGTDYTFEIIETGSVFTLLPTHKSAYIEATTTDQRPDFCNFGYCGDGFTPIDTIQDAMPNIAISYKEFCVLNYGNVVSTSADTLTCHDLTANTDIDLEITDYDGTYVTFNDNKDQITYSDVFVFTWSHEGQKGSVAGTISKFEGYEDYPAEEAPIEEEAVPAEEA